MLRLRNQEGAALIMVLGIGAALAILGATLVMVTGNSQGGTQIDAQRTQTFNVAEAGLDNAVYQMGAAWPSAAGPMDMGPTFRNPFPTEEFPDPPAGKQFIDVTLTAPDPADYPADSNWWVTSQANVGGKASRIRALVQRVSIGVSTLAPGVALYAGGDVALIGNSTISGPLDNGQPIASGQVYGNMSCNGNINFSRAPMHIRGEWSGSGNIIGTKTTHDQTVPTFDEVMPPSAILNLKNIAQATPTNGTVYNGLSYTGNNDVTYTSPLYINGNLVLNGNGTFKAPAVYVKGNVTAMGNTKIDVGSMYVTGSWSTTGNVQFTNLGPTYIAGDVTMTGNGTWRMPLIYSDGNVTFTGNESIGGNGVGSNIPPTIIYTSKNLSWNGNGAFYGLISAGGDFTGNGNGMINGQVIVKGHVKPTGNFNLTYNTDVNNGIRTNAAYSAKLVTNTWQEIKVQ